MTSTLQITEGATLILTHFQIHRFPFFGLTAYSVLAATLYGIMKIEYQMGKPEIMRQKEAQ